MSEEREAVVIRGLIVDVNLPSRDVLTDWTRFMDEDVRLKEVVELFPEEIYKTLESIRRGFYYHLERLTIPAYTLKVLPFSSLPAFQRIVEETRARFNKLDEMIIRSLESAYTKRAVEYFKTKWESKPRLTSRVSNRFRVSLIPLKLDRILWDEFLNETMKKELERIRRSYETRKQILEKKLSNVKEQIKRGTAEMERLKSELKMAREEVDKAYEERRLPYDVGMLKLEKADLKKKITNLRAKARELQDKIIRLEREREARETRFANAIGWTQRETRETEKRIRIDASRLWQEDLEALIGDALNALEEQEPIRSRELRKLERNARTSLERLGSAMPGSTLITSYEKFLIAVKDAQEGKIKQAKKALEVLV